MEYDLINLFDHPVYLCDFIAYAIVTFGTETSNQCVIQVEWKPSAEGPTTSTELTLRWDLDAIRVRHPLIDKQLRSLRERDHDQATRTENAAVVVGVAVLAHLEPETKLTFRSKTGTGHDYYLNDTRDEMIEMAGKWNSALPSLFEETRTQSNQNRALRKRWVTVTVMRQTPRNRTEGLHSCPQS